MSNHASNEARVIPLRPATAPDQVTRRPPGAGAPADHTPRRTLPALTPRPTPPASGRREPLWRDLVGDVLRRERLAQERTLKDVADAARISMPYLSELERGRKEASSEVLAAAARALGLGLTDLLSRAQEELTRPAQVRPGRRHTPSSSRHDGLCLAA
ncbi:helix-turn-helix transcriptional regulator [Streptomyces sp. NPDC006333]|uniref:helix-turn-helix domain-containing protein n=1 Tax=Streptomyces sp. NPDC006333 TaxID=3156753 RepID=UPI0033B006DE